MWKIRFGIWVFRMAFVDRNPGDEQRGFPSTIDLVLKRKRIELNTTHVDNFTSRIKGREMISAVHVQTLSPEYSAVLKKENRTVSDHYV